MFGKGVNKVQSVKYLVRSATMFIIIIIIIIIIIKSSSIDRKQLENN